MQPIKHKKIKNYSRGDLVILGGQIVLRYLCALKNAGKKNSTEDGSKTHFTLQWLITLRRNNRCKI